MPIAQRMKNEFHKQIIMAEENTRRSIYKLADWFFNESNPMDGESMVINIIKYFDFRPFSLALKSSARGTIGKEIENKRNNVRRPDPV